MGEADYLLTDDRDFLEMSPFKRHSNFDTGGSPLTNRMSHENPLWGAPDPR